MKNYLCKCNNCDSVLIDENPQSDALMQKLNGSEKQMVLLYDKEEETNFWACPICKTDDYLTDNIN